MTRLAAIILDWLQFRFGFLGDFSRLVFSTDKVQWVAVSIQKSDCLFHTGIVYRSEGTSVYIVHQAAHMMFRDQLWRGSGAFAIPLLKEEDAKYLAGFCARIGRAHKDGRIPYSFQFDPDLLFDRDTGRLLTTDSGAGFSCSTFVAAVFRSSGIGLIREITWPRNAPPSDVASRQSILKSWMESGRPELTRRCQELQSEIRTRRISPQQVAGACLQARLPCGYRCATENGRRIADKTP